MTVQVEKNGLFWSPNGNKLSKYLSALLVFSFVFSSCLAQDDNFIDPSGWEIRHRFIPPKGYHRPDVRFDSFGWYLRRLPLKAHNAPVSLYNGSLKPKQGVHAAVINLPIGKKNLHQCADAVIRLRADYLYAQRRFSDIHFNFTNGFRADYPSWMSGKRVKVTGAMVEWVDRGGPSNTEQDYWQYLETVFTYAGTISLSQELDLVYDNDIQIGDIYIQGGSPGHAIIVVDMCVNPDSGEKLFLLAQSYMPAQEIHILRNPKDQDLSPWYTLDGDEIITPEWEFSAADLMRFSDF